MNIFENPAFVQSLMCPLSKSIFIEPVSDPDNITYEKTYIERQLRTYGKLPNGKPLSIDQLKPNKSMEKLVAEYHKYTMSLMQIDDENNDIVNDDDKDSFVVVDNGSSPLNIKPISSINAIGKVKLPTPPVINNSNSSINITGKRVLPKLTKPDSLINSMCKRILPTQFITNTKTISNNIEPQFMTANFYELPQFEEAIHYVSYDANSTYKITIPQVPPEYFMRYRRTIYFLIDISGSMGTECILENEKTDIIFSRLDLVKNCLITYLMLADNDKVGIIAYDNTADIIFEGVINDSNRNNVINIVKSLNPRGGTMFDPALGALSSLIKKNRDTGVEIVILTDGCFNDRPKNCLNNLLNNDRYYKDKKIPFKINTVAFSYDANSILLNEISDLTGGQDYFISDISMMVITFCNLLSNLWSPDLGSSTVELLTTIPNNILIEKVDDIEFNLKFEIMRTRLSELLSSIIKNNDNNSLMKIRDFYQKIEPQINYEKLNNIEPAYFTMMGLDLFSDDESQGQISKSLSNMTVYKKWGQRYLIAVSSCYKHRFCSNFKDNCPQLFGSTFNKEFLLFMTQFYSTSVPRPDSSIIDMTKVSPKVQANINTSLTSKAAGCMVGSCNIKLFDGSSKRLDELNGDELLFNDTDVPSKIMYITKTRVFKPKLCQFDKLLITPYHPIYSKNIGYWIFPIDCCDVIEYDNVDYVYNIVLQDSDGTNNIHVEIEDVKCITLAHNVKSFDASNSVLEHEFYGTNKIIETLKQFSSDNSKIIELSNHSFIRDLNTSRVYDIRLNEV